MLLSLHRLKGGIIFLPSLLCFVSSLGVAAAAVQINVDSASSDQAKQLIEYWTGKNESDEHIFDRCYQEIFDLTARDVFTRFLKSPDYKAMLCRSSHVNHHHLMDESDNIIIFPVWF